MSKKPPRRDPVIVYRRGEDRGLKPFLPRTGGYRMGRDAAPRRQQKPKKQQKEPKTVLPEKVRFHNQCLEATKVLDSPEQEIAKACYYLCFLVHETKTNSDLFPLKHKILEKIFKSSHSCLTVHHVRRGDREIYHLSSEAKKKWEAETGGNKHHQRMYVTPKCKIEYEKGYFDLYNFHIILEPFRFSFYLPLHQSPWLDKRRLSRRKFHYPQTVEYGLVGGKQITTSRKATMVTLEEIKKELDDFLKMELNDS